MPRKAFRMSVNEGAAGEYASRHQGAVFGEREGEGRRELELPEVVTTCYHLGLFAGGQAQHADRLAALMITYPSTHGVFEEGIKEIIQDYPAENTVTQRLL